ncbi:MAG: metalloregulator ArsR/SmtB family transcription factor [Phycisphaerales bacterium]
MARAPTTLDPFNALAEPKRREVLAALAIEGGDGELPVNTVVQVLGWPQPQVSKHLAVLREVGLVSVRRNGRERLYRVNGEAIKSVHDWTKLFERFWESQLARIKRRAEEKARKAADANDSKHT